MRARPSVGLSLCLWLGAAGCGPTVSTAPGAPPAPGAAPSTTAPATTSTATPTATATTTAVAATSSAPPAATSARPSTSAPPGGATVAQLDEVCRQGSTSSAVPAVARACAAGLVCCTRPQGINAPQVAFCRTPCTTTTGSGPSGCRDGCPWALVP